SPRTSRGINPGFRQSSIEERRKSMASHERPRRYCATMEVHHKLADVDPGYRHARREIERLTAAYEAQAAAGAVLRTGIVKIPVVVHVVYPSASENISHAQIHSQIDVLNQDYRKLNPDVANVPTPFRPRVADAP